MNNLENGINSTLSEYDIDKSNSNSNKLQRDLTQFIKEALDEAYTEMVLQRV